MYTHCESELVADDNAFEKERATNIVSPHLSPCKYVLCMVDYQLPSAYRRSNIRKLGDDLIWLS